MNLYIFNENHRGTIFGIGTYIQELIFALSDSNIQITVINLLSDKMQIQFEEIKGIKYWHLPAPILELRARSDKELRVLYFRNITYLLQLYIKDKNKLVFHLNYHRNENFANELKKVFKCTIISVVHFSDWGFTIFDNPERLQYLLKLKEPNKFEANIQKIFEEERIDYIKSDHLICLSNYMKQILFHHYNIDLTKISVISNGLKDMVNTSINTIFLRKKWHIKQEDKIILFAGRLDEVKGVSFLIRAFRKVLISHPGSHLIIAGNGIYDFFIEEAKDISLKVTFTGLLSKEKLYELYRIANVGVVPSLFEPFGYVPVEMMMHELPIVATATSGLNEVVDESCGLKVPLIVSPDNVEIDTSLLAQKIIYLLQNPEEAKRLGKNGRKRYLEKYSSEVFGKNMIAFYKSLFQECK